MALGDLAFALALDLLTDAQWLPTVEDLAEESLLGPQDPSLSAWQHRQEFLKQHSRSELRDRFRSAWRQNGPYEWDATDLCLRPSRNTRGGSPNPSLERTTGLRPVAAQLMIR